MTNQNECPECGMEEDEKYGATIIYLCGSSAGSNGVGFVKATACQTIAKLKEENEEALHHGRQSLIQEIQQTLKNNGFDYRIEHQSDIIMRIAIAFRSCKQENEELKRKVGPLEEMQKEVSSAFRQMRHLGILNSSPLGWTAQFLRTWAKASAKQRRKA